jgi:hypothetical protein
MFRLVVRLYKKAKKIVQRVAAVVLQRADERLRQAWVTHGAKVKTDATYAAVVTVVLSGIFGVVPVRDVAAAILAGLLGVFVNSRQNRNASHISRWDDGRDPWDLA